MFIIGSMNSVNMKRASMTTADDMYLLKDSVKLETKKQEIKQMLIDNGEDPNDFDIEALAENAEF